MQNPLVYVHLYHHRVSPAQRVSTQSAIISHERPIHIPTYLSSFCSPIRRHKQHIALGAKCSQLINMQHYNKTAQTKSIERTDCSGRFGLGWPNADTLASFNNKSNTEASRPIVVSTT
eukprot:20217-Heterococcus_DN1.PRE.1